MSAVGVEREPTERLSVPLIISLVLIAGVWAAGAVWSFGEQREFAERLGFHVTWLLPAVADGLPIAMGAVAFSAALDGRPSLGARLGTALAAMVLALGLGWVR